MVSSIDVGYNYVMKDYVRSQIEGTDIEDFLEERNFFCRDSIEFRPSEFILHTKGLKKILYEELKSVKKPVGVSISCEIDSAGKVLSIEFDKRSNNFDKKTESKIKLTLSKYRFYPGIRRGKKVSTIFYFSHFFNINN